MLHRGSFFESSKGKQKHAGRQSGRRPCGFHSGAKRIRTARRGRHSLRHQPVREKAGGVSQSEGDRRTALIKGDLHVLHRRCDLL